MFSGATSRIAERRTVGARARGPRASCAGGWAGGEPAAREAGAAAVRAAYRAPHAAVTAGAFDAALLGDWRHS